MDDIYIVEKLNDNSYVIDKGSDDGITFNDRLLIYQKGSEIKDLNGNSLGFLEIPKLKCKVFHIQPKLTVITEIINRATELGSLSGMVTNFFPKENQPSYDEVFSQFTREIKIGDPVKIMSK